MSSIYGSHKSFKSESSTKSPLFVEKRRILTDCSTRENPMTEKRLVSVCELDAERDHAVLAWTLRWMFWYAARCKVKSGTVQITDFTLHQHKVESGKTFILYRNQMLRLLSFPKPVFDQLCIELPCLMGFRSSEVTSWMAEYIDFQNMNTLVMDAKKKVLFTVPLNLYVAKHAEEVLDGEAHGIVLRSRSNRNRGERLTPFAVWHIWKKYTTRLPNAKDISPLTGRQFFAAEWYYKQGLSLVTLQLIMRHARFETTIGYVRNLIFQEDVQRDYNKFQFRLMQELQEKKEVYA